MRGVSKVESVAEHSYRMAMMALTLHEASDATNLDRMIKMCLVHDLAEVLVGDITPFDGIEKEKKKLLEKRAMLALVQDLPESKQAELLALFEEYESQESDEARFVKDLDRLEMCLTALEYEEAEQIDLEEFFASVKDKFRFDSVRVSYEQCYQQHLKLQSLLCTSSRP